VKNHLVIGEPTKEAGKRNCVMKNKRDIQRTVGANRHYRSSTLPKGEKNLSITRDKRNLKLATGQWGKKVDQETQLGWRKSKDPW